MKFNAKIKKFNTNNIKTFKEIYRDIEFKNLDLDFINSRLLTKTTIYKEKPLR
jgi:hypothetical protein